MNIRAICDRANQLAHCVGGEVAAILVRITIGQAFIQAGLGKLQNHDRTAMFFQSLGIPLPGLQAWFIGGVEMLGGVALLIGLGVRPAATLLLSTMVVAILTAHRGEFADAIAINPDKGLTEVVPWMYGLLLLGLLAHGGGRLALDRLLCRKACGDKPPAGEPAKT